MLRADGTALGDVAVLGNDTDPDNDQLTVKIEEPPPIGVSTANADGTVRVDSLPSGFKGVTWFKYRVTDPDGLSSVATAVVYVGTDPFRVLFAGDPTSNGSPEVYLANFLAAPTAVTAATEGTLRLKGFVASDNGSTVVYRRQDTATPSITDLSFVRTATPSQQVRITMPSGTTLVQDADGNDQYRVSPDGQWIAFIARDASNVQAIYVVNVATPATVSKVNVPGAQSIMSARFVSNSQDLYLLASPATNGANRSLYAVSLSSLSVSLVSAPNALVSADDVINYSVAPDQSRVLIQANRGGREGLYFIDTSHLQTEVQVSHPFALTEHLVSSTIGLPPGRGGSTSGQRVAYITQDVHDGYRIYVADVSSTPNPTLATACMPVKLEGCGLGLRPDGAAVLYVTRDVEVHEIVLASGADSLISAGQAGWYDSTGNIVLIEQLRPSGGTPSSYTGLGVALRGSFGSAVPLGTAGLAASKFTVDGFDRGVVILGEGPTTGSAPSAARLALVNAVASDKLLYLADFQSPLELTSPVAQVVSN
jgi:Tol biopolymer transport system component